MLEINALIWLDTHMKMLHWVDSVSDWLKHRQMVVHGQWRTDYQTYSCWQNVSGCIISHLIFKFSDFLTTSLYMPDKLSTHYICGTVNHENAWIIYHVSYLMVLWLCSLAPTRDHTYTECLTPSRTDAYRQAFGWSLVDFRQTRTRPFVMEPRCIWGMACTVSMSSPWAAVCPSCSPRID